MFFGQIMVLDLVEVSGCVRFGSDLRDGVFCRRAGSAGSTAGRDACRYGLRRAVFTREVSKICQDAKTIFKNGLRHNASLSLIHWDFPGFGKISHELFTRPQIPPMFMRVP